jgi:hypothetical protein
MTLWLDFWLALDQFAGALLFNRLGVCISTLACLVRDHKADALKLWQWQKAFLAWLAPRLGQAHCERSRQSDLTRAKLMVTLLS